MTENLDKSTFELLDKFVSSGGTLIAFSEPTLIDGSPSDDLKNFFSSNSGKIIEPANLTDEVIQKLFSSPQIAFNDVMGGTLYHQRRILTDGQLIFLVNSSLESPVTGTFKTKGADAIETEYPHRREIRLSERPDRR